MTSLCRVIVEGKVCRHCGYQLVQKPAINDRTKYEGWQHYRAEADHEAEPERRVSGERRSGEKRSFWQRFGSWNWRRKAERRAGKA